MRLHVTTASDRGKRPAKKGGDTHTCTIVTVGGKRVVSVAVRLVIDQNGAETYKITTVTPLGASFATVSGQGDRLE